MSPIRVLLADDHAVLRDGLRLYLSTQPDIVVVGEAADGCEALAAVEALQPDIVLMDVAMPRLNGIEATLRIRRQWPGFRVLVLSQHNRKEYVQHSLQAGAAGYVLKKAGGAEVAAAIRAVYEGHVHLNPEVADAVIEDYVERLAAAEARRDVPFNELTDRETGGAGLGGRGTLHARDRRDPDGECEDRRQPPGGHRTEARAAHAGRACPLRHSRGPDRRELTFHVCGSVSFAVGIRSITDCRTAQAAHNEHGSGSAHPPLPF